MLYRALRNLSAGPRKGEPFRGDELTAEARSILEARGIIAPIVSPPVEIFDWTDTHAAALDAAGVATIGEILERDAIDGIDGADFVELQRKAWAALTVESGCKNCRGGRNA